MPRELDTRADGAVACIKRACEAARMIPLSSALSIFTAVDHPLASLQPFVPAHLHHQPLLDNHHVLSQVRRRLPARADQHRQRPARQDDHDRGDTRGLRHHHHLVLQVHVDGVLDRQDDVLQHQVHHHLRPRHHVQTVHDVRWPASRSVFDRN